MRNALHWRGFRISSKGMGDEHAGDLRMGTGRGRWVLGATRLGSAVVMLDGTIVNIALPAIGRNWPLTKHQALHYSATR